MIRKQTKLESNLIYLHFKLSHKTYCGKHRDKVEFYVYVREIDSTQWLVYLDKYREKIVNYSVKNINLVEFNKGIINGLNSVFEAFEGELGLIYDFETTTTKDLYIDNSFGENEPMTDFVEESAFDE